MLILDDGTFIMFQFFSSFIVMFPCTDSYQTIDVRERRLLLLLLLFTRKLLGLRNFF